MNPDPGFVHVYEPGSSGRTLLLLHGTGGNEHDLLPLGKELDPEAARLSPRGPVLENGHPRFFRRFAEGIFDLEDLKQRTNDLADFILGAAREYQLDPGQIVAVGYSNGANIAASILLRRPEVIRAAILLRAMVPFEPEQLPDLAGTKVWIAGGNEDTIIPRANTERLATMLSEAGAIVTANFFDAGHGLTNTELVLARRWLEQLALRPKAGSPEA
jgi:predicted esterase